MLSTPRPSWKLLGSLWMLGFVPMVAGAVRLSGLAGGVDGGGAAPENMRFMAMPAPVVMHIVCASLFCVLGALQFDTALRQRNPRVHRIAGRVAAPSGIVAALTGLWMTAAYAIPPELQGPLLYGVRIVVGLAMTGAVVLSVRAVIQRRITQHRAWMIRAYALGQGAGTQVLILLPVTLLAGAPTFMFRDVLMALAWALNMAFAEWVIRSWLPSAQSHLAAHAAGLHQGGLRLHGEVRRL